MIDISSMTEIQLNEFVTDCFKKIKSGEIETPNISFDTPIEELKKLPFEEFCLGMMKILFNNWESVSK